MTAVFHDQCYVVAGRFHHIAHERVTKTVTCKTIRLTVVDFGNFSCLPTSASDRVIKGLKLLMSMVCRLESRCHQKMTC